MQSLSTREAKKIQRAVKVPLDWHLRSHARTCDKKRKFSSKRNAKAAIKKMKHPGKAILVAYLCAHCGAWHMGSRHSKPRGER